jgi:hypothetical protein
MSNIAKGPVPTIFASKQHSAPSVFQPANLLREARRQRGLPAESVPAVCALDPDGDMVRNLRTASAARRAPGWACYHTDMYVTDHAGLSIGIVGCAVGAPFAVLVAEQLFVSGCRFLVSITSPGQIEPQGSPPYFVLIDRALRDQGTSHHYLPTEDAIAAARAHGALAVEMEAAALYAFARAQNRPVLCFAHVTNQMARIEGDFEKGEADGTRSSLNVIATAARACGFGPTAGPGDPRARL